MRIIAVAIGTTLLTCACGSGGLSVEEMQRAATDHTRATMPLGPDAKLEATVFVGKEVRGKMTFCGYVRGRDSEGRKIDPREFVATNPPLEWLVFQSVHSPTIRAQPGTFVTWTEVCGASPRA